MTIGVFWCDYRLYQLTVIIVIYHSYVIVIEINLMILKVKTKVQKTNVHTKQYELMDQEVEVLTVHFAKGTMRVRWVENDPRTYEFIQGKVQTVDMSNKDFLQQYSIIGA